MEVIEKLIIENILNKKLISKKEGWIFSKTSAAVLKLLRYCYFEEITAYLKQYNLKKI